MYVYMYIPIRNLGQLQIESTGTEYTKKRLRTYQPTPINNTHTGI